jgi:hypothetical protein
LGLYDPKHPRRAPTRYAKSIAAKYQDVLSGKATAIKVPKSYAKEVAGQYRTRSAGKKATVVVPKSGGGKVRYSRKENTLVRDIGSFHLTPIKDRMVLLRGNWPKLKKGEAVAVRIGNNYISYYSLDEVRAAMAEYDPNKTTLWQYPYIIKVKKSRAT